MQVLPGLVAAIIIFCVGWVAGVICKRIVMKILQKTRVDDWMEEQNLVSAIGNKKISAIAGSIVKWYIIAVFIAQAVELVQLKVLREFVTSAVYWFPNLILAGLIIFAGLILGRYIRNAIEATKHSFKCTIGLVLEILIIYAAVVMAVQTIKIDATILIVAFALAVGGFVIAIGIATGISFGLALKDEAKSIVKELRKK
jgi:hypothetical protein